jgi:hypothetical protein
VPLLRADRLDLREFELGAGKMLRCKLLLLGRWGAGQCANSGNDFFNGERVWLSRAGQTMLKLRLEFCFPAADLGPVLRLALARLAAICFSDANVPGSCV